MKIKYAALFFATALSTISLNVWLTQLVEANEGKIVGEFIQEAGKILAPKAIEYAATTYPIFGAIVMGVGAIVIGVGAIFVITSAINK
jgi:hypothetical protein